MFSHTDAKLAGALAHLPSFPAYRFGAYITTRQNGIRLLSQAKLELSHDRATVGGIVERDVVDLPPRTGQLGTRRPSWGPRIIKSSLLFFLSAALRG